MYKLRIYKHYGSGLRKSHCTSHCKNQKGVATVLLVVLLGLAMTASSIGVLRSLQANRQQQMASHAVTHSQTAAWAGVENLRLYLETIPESDMSGLAQTIEMSAGEGTIEYTITDLDYNEAFGVEPATVTALITAIDDNAKASTAIYAHYAIAGSSCFKCTILSTPVRLHSNSSVRGTLNGISSTGTPISIAVEGEVSLEKGNVSGVESIYATEDVTLGAGIDIPEVYSNGSIYLKSSAQVGVAKALHKVELVSGNPYVDTAYTNGGLELHSGDSNITHTLGDSNITSGSHVSLTSKGPINISESSSISIDKMSATGTIAINSSISAKEIRSTSDVTCPSDSWSSFDSLITEAETHDCVDNKDEVQERMENVSISLMSPLLPISMPKPVVDVVSLKNAANYVFEVEANKIKVTVSGINNIPDGEYFLGVIPGERADFLCHTVSGSGDSCLQAGDRSCECDASIGVEHTISICNNNSSKGCLSYDVSSDTWNVSGTNLAPGVLWFDGDLHLTGSTYYNTILATGDVSTQGNSTIRGLNYSGEDAAGSYATICELNYEVGLSSYFVEQEVYPTEYCDKSAGKMHYSALGNIALMAGSYENGAYYGGDINLGSGNTIYGTLVSGDNIVTAGNTTFNGYVTAVGQLNIGDNSLSGTTEFNIDHANSMYKAYEIPLMIGGDTCLDECASDGSSVTLRWSKVL